MVALLLRVQQMDEVVVEIVAAAMNQTLRLIMPPLYCLKTVTKLVFLQEFGKIFGIGDEVVVEIVAVAMNQSLT
jgi:hypothetical protein